MKFQVTDFNEDCPGLICDNESNYKTNDYNRFSNEYGNLDVTVFYNNVYFLKNGLSPSGVSIGSGQYIAYNLSSSSNPVSYSNLP